MAVAEIVANQQAAAGIQANWLTPSPGRSLHAAEVEALEPNILHVHGLWRLPNRVAARLQNRIPLVVSSHGMLDPWAFAQHRRRKTLLWWAYERRCLQRAAALQALCPAERQSLRQLGLKTPIALIPNGVSLPTAGPTASPGSLPLLPQPCWAGTIPADAKVLLFLGRFHHKKGLKHLLSAWQSVAQDAARAGWWLALVGYGDEGQLQRQLTSNPIRHVAVYGPVFDAHKQAVLAAASAFVLPSYSEGLPMAALEAMAHQLPCLLSAACNLPEAFAAGAALSAESNSAAIASALQQLFALSAADRAAMGAAGQALVREHFSWPVVAQQTLALYRWILGGGERPDFVELA